MPGHRMTPRASNKQTRRAGQSRRGPQNGALRSPLKAPKEDPFDSSEKQEDRFPQELLSSEGSVHRLLPVRLGSSFTAPIKRDIAASTSCLCKSLRHAKPDTELQISGQLLPGHQRHFHHLSTFILRCCVCAQTHPYRVLGM